MIDECGTQAGTILAIPPSEGLGSAESVLDAWEKVDTVYGKGTLARHCKREKEHVLSLLKNNPRYGRESETPHFLALRCHAAID